MKRQRIPALPPAVKSASTAICIGCGCDDEHACVDGFDEPCGWVEVDRNLGIGICSGHAITDGRARQMRQAYKALRRRMRSDARKLATYVAGLAASRARL